jgi:uncharacterized delta-60 repeat protein
MNLLLRKRLIVVGVASASILSSAALALAAGGDLDPGFGGDGKVITNLTPGFDVAHAVAVQPDGKILAVGRAGGSDVDGGTFALVRYEADGRLDATFGSGGKVTTDFDGPDEAANAVALQANGAIVVAGRAGGHHAHFALARYTDDGNLDPSFGSNGKVTLELTPGDDVASSLLIQADGKIVAVGTANADKFALVRFNANGTLDTSFGGTGVVVT